MPNGTETPPQYGTPEYQRLRAQEYAALGLQNVPITPIQQFFASEGTEQGELAQQILRQLGLELVGPRAAGIQEALLQQTRLAGGSPQEILTQFNDQISGIQEQLRGISRQVARQGGPGLGGQRQRAQGQALGQAASQLQNIFAQGQRGGLTGLLNIASGIRPLTATQIPPGRESISSASTGLAGAGEAAGALAGLLRNVFTPSPTVPTFNFGAPSPFAPQATGFPVSQLQNINYSLFTPPTATSFGSTGFVDPSIFAAAPAAGASTGSLAY